jgi:hypothetical protein
LLSRLRNGLHFEDCRLRGWSLQSRGKPGRWGVSRGSRACLCSGMQ